MLFLFSRKQVAFISFLFGIPLIIGPIALIGQGFTDYLISSILLIIGSLLILGGYFAYKDSLDR
jgi:hypothetical protein